MEFGFLQPAKGRRSANDFQRVLEYDCGWRTQSQGGISLAEIGGPRVQQILEERGPTAVQVQEVRPPTLEAHEGDPDVDHSPLAFLAKEFDLHIHDASAGAREGQLSAVCGIRIRSPCGEGTADSCILSLVGWILYFDGP